MHHWNPKSYHSTNLVISWMSPQNSWTAFHQEPHGEPQPVHSEYHRNLTIPYSQPSPPWTQPLPDQIFSSSSKLSSCPALKRGYPLTNGPIPAFSLLIALLSKVLKAGPLRILYKPTLSTYKSRLLPLCLPLECFLSKVSSTRSASTTALISLQTPEVSMFNYRLVPPNKDVWKPHIQSYNLSHLTYQ